MSKLLTFTDTRGGVTNTQSVRLHEDLIDRGEGRERLKIALRIDSTGEEAFIETNLEAHGIDDVNELAQILIKIGHQIGHDFGHRCNLKSKPQATEINPDDMPDEFKEALGSLLDGLAEAARASKEGK